MVCLYYISAHRQWKLANNFNFWCYYASCRFSAVAHINEYNVVTFLRRNSAVTPRGNCTILFTAFVPYARVYLFGIQKTHAKFKQVCFRSNIYIDLDIKIYLRTSKVLFSDL